MEKLIKKKVSNDKQGQFIKLLAPSVAIQPGYPNKYHVACHLKLLNSFKVLRDITTEKFDKPQYKDKVWQCYVTLATRRFALFVTALKLKFKEYDKEKLNFEEFMNNLLPPLDVLLVWHSFLLNPKSMYDNFCYNEFERFLGIPFPLGRVDESISNDKFIFIPSIDLSDNFSDLMTFALDKLGLEETFNYNAYDEIHPTNIDIPVYCPCGKKLTTTFLSVKGQYGFADKEFGVKSIDNCDCGFHSFIDHTELRKRKLFFDTASDRPLPSIKKYYTRTHKTLPITVESVDDSSKAEVFLSEKQFKNLPLKLFIVESMRNSKLTKYDALILRDYLDMNPISLTIPPGECTFSVQEDLVACVLRQEKFVNKMVRLDWIHSPFIEITIIEAMERYHKFFSLMEHSNHSIVPTLDIDLVWHTHQLFQSKYFDFCQDIAGYIIDHNDKIEQGRLDDGFEKTCKLYKSRFDEEYSICLCEYCLSKRTKTRKLFSRKPKTPLVSYQYESIYHVSSHNATNTPTERGIRKLDKLNQKYQNVSLPWETDNDFISNIHINDSFVNFDRYDKEHALLYKNGGCGTVIDKASACGGIKGTGGFFQGSCGSSACVGSGIQARPSACGAYSTGFAMSDIGTNCGTQHGASCAAGPRYSGDNGTSGGGSSCGGGGGGSSCGGGGSSCGSS